MAAASNAPSLESRCVYTAIARGIFERLATGLSTSRILLDASEAELRRVSQQASLIGGDK
ncbi:MAG: hypothetical protein NVSMB1_21670 [Polyangiales bacterium]